MKRLFVIVAFALTGCATAQHTDVAPINWRHQTVEAVKGSFKDPYSIRDASVTAPIYQPAIFDGVTPLPNAGYVVCVKANAKNSFGAYTGPQIEGYLFQNGRVAFVIPPGQLSNGYLCGGQFTPFPEIESRG